MYSMYPLSDFKVKSFFFLLFNLKLRIPVFYMQTPHPNISSWYLNFQNFCIVWLAFSGIWTGDTLNLPKCVWLTLLVLLRCKKIKSGKSVLPRYQLHITRLLAMLPSLNLIIRSTAKMGNQSHNFLTNDWNTSHANACCLFTFHNGELILYSARFARHKLRQRSHN